MFLYTLLFTLQDKDASKNKYVDMFYIWLTFVKRNAGLKATDTVCLFVDDRTLDVLNSNEILDIVLGDSIFKFEIWSIPVPATLSDGISQRYTIASHDIHLFLDLDILVQNPISPALQGFQSSPWFACMPEGHLLHSDYGGHLLTPCDTYSTLSGFSAGWFAFTPCRTVAEMFCKMQTDILKNKDTPFYTIDQPFFNKAMIELQESNTTHPMTSYFLSSNLYTNNVHLNTESSASIFCNYCGEPGNDTFHFQKLLLALSLAYQESTPVLKQGELCPPQESSPALPH